MFNKVFIYLIFILINSAISNCVNGVDSLLAGLVDLMEKKLYFTFKTNVRFLLVFTKSTTGFVTVTCCI